jgi:tetratricopeptide (TPR) repeat protein
LLESPQPRRYQFHDLVRLHARGDALRKHPEPHRLATLTRLFAFYTATAWHTLALLLPGNPRLASADPRWTTGGLRFPAASAALDWLEAERSNLLAAITQAASTTGIPARLPGQLTRALLGFFIVRSYPKDAVDANQTILQLSQRDHDPATEAHSRNDLGVAYRWLGQHVEALACHQASLVLFRNLGDRLNQAGVLNNLGLANARLGRYGAALTHLRHSLDLCRELGDLWGQAHNLNSLGMVYARLGRHTEALACLQDISLLQQFGDGDAWGQANNLNHLGVVYQQLGQYSEAIACHQDSLAIHRELGVPHGQVEALRGLGDALWAADRHKQAASAWGQALAICEALELPETDEIRTRLAGASHS